MVLGAPAPFLAGISAMQDPDRWEAAVAGLTGSWLAGHEDVSAIVQTVDRMRGHGFSMWSKAGELIGDDFARNGSPLTAFGGLTRTIPVLHPYAEPDDDSYLAAQRAHAHSAPWFEVHRLCGAHSHFPMLEAPDEIAARVEDLVQSRVLAPATR
jgi:pimeloyl-ACP methyl ester carboxylesterase